MTNDSGDWPRNRETRINLFPGRSRSVGTFRPPHMEPGTSRLREPRLSIGAGIRDLERRTAEVPNILRSNINNIIDELRPIVERARTNTDNIMSVNNDGNVTLASWLNSQHAITAPPRDPNNPTSSSDDVVIDVETTPPNPPAVPTSTTPTSNVPSPTHSAETANNSNNGSGDEQDIAEQQMLNVTNGVVVNTLCKYLPFFVLILTKYFFDNVMGLALFTGLFMTFYYLNIAVKKEVGRQTSRTFGSFMFFLLHLIGGVVIVIILFYEENDILIFSRSVFSHEKPPSTLSGLLWGVIVTDYLVKIITVIVKGLFVLLPQKVIPTSKRGKWFLFIEASSQLFRNMLPIQAWLHYLLQSYIGPHKVIGVFLSAAYMVSKGNLLLGALKLWWMSLIKVVRNVTIGTTPSKEQIATAGNQCSICHDEFKTPVLLECQHIFCEICVTKWLDREQTCPLCRAKIVDDPSWRDGSTTHFIQLF
ncbi:hypothetical protein V9T40_013401 [Parthenolecanium corni]|uniref:RING-type domain-containing protein n=1 Tax=Parthenolecanium corni TaxID=536013 RepID=A0AAN9Y5N6_9HEMI